MKEPKGKHDRCRRIVALLLLGCLFLVAARSGWAAEKSTKPKVDTAGPQALLKNDAPIKISSDRMEVDQKEKLVTFEGHVVVQQKDLTITGKLMRVYTLKESEGSDASKADSIDRIEVEGEVRIVQQNKVATANKAVYYHGPQKIVLMGEPRFSQGQDTIKGRLITLYLPEQRTVVEGGQNTPVHAVLHPEQKEQ